MSGASPDNEQPGLKMTAQERETAMTGNRSWFLNQGYKPVRNIDGEELGLAKNKLGAAHVLVRLVNRVTGGGPFRVVDIDVTETEEAFIV
jgi:hypothetical protein